MIIIIIKGFVNNPSFNLEIDRHKVISHAILVFIILVLIRQGNYMLNGLPLLFLLYHYNGISYNEKINSLNEE